MIKLSNKLVIIPYLVGIGIWVDSRIDFRERVRFMPPTLFSTEGGL